MASSSDPEIKDGLTIPVWMKTKPARDFDFAASPPPQEDSFFIRYPKTDFLFGKSKIDQNISKVIKGSTEVTSAPVEAVKEKDWSKHTKPCQDVLHSIAPINTAVNSPNIKPKPAGTDDGFKGEGAACGTSIVKVAHQMVSSRSPRGTEGAASEMSEGVDVRRRRGSRSLPASPPRSPHSSPTSRRKNCNRYFTSPYEPVTETGVGGWWVTQALLGYKKELASSANTLDEEPLDQRLQGVSLAESVENLGPAPRSKNLQMVEDKASLQPKSAKTSPAFRPKPSELREMNFLSPTSM